MGKAKCLVLQFNQNVAKSQKESESVMLKPLKRKPMLQATKNDSVKSKNDVKEKKTNKLPPDAYKDEIEPLSLFVDETREFIFSVKRGGEFGLPMCDVRQYQTTDLYTGFTKKGINFPIELLPDLIEMLQEVYHACEEKELL